jgi:peptide/nickel transport system ATP-binding protein
MLLEIKDLTVSFNTNNGVYKALKGINLSINKSEIIGLVGESGSGKSVTSLAIIQLLEKNALVTGEINFETISLLKLSDKEIRKFRGNKIGMIFQEPMTSLNPVMKCGQQVIESIILHQKLSKKAAKEKTLALFNEVNLPEPELTFEKYPHELSGGQKQRVMIAMALACDPKLLIADEPTTALDVTVQKNILQLFKEIREKRNMSIIFISHDLGVINEIADSILVMYQGEIVEQGAVKNIFENPQHPYTKGLLACRPNPNYQLKRLPTLSDFAQIKDGVFKSNLNDINNLREICENNLTDILSKRAQLYLQEPILSVTQLNTWFTQKRKFFTKNKTFTKAVNNVSFNVYPGETLGLVGESGCGKTTLSRTILKLLQPSSGKIKFNGIDLESLNDKQMRPLRKNIQIIFQDPYSALNPSQTIGNSILEPLIVHQILNNNLERKNFVNQLLEKVGLSSNYFNRYPHELSGGQRQRVVIARALALKPKLIICDESVSALDVSVQAQIINLLKDLQQEFKLTYIFISHDLAVVKHVSDRIMVMRNGEIIEIGTPENIYNHPQNDYTKNLINAIPNRLNSFN